MLLISPCAQFWSVGVIPTYPSFVTFPKHLISYLYLVIWIQGGGGRCGRWGNEWSGIMKWSGRSMISAAVAARARTPVLWSALFTPFCHERWTHLFVGQQRGMYATGYHQVVHIPLFYAGNSVRRPSYILNISRRLLGGFARNSVPTGWISRNLIFEYFQKICRGFSSFITICQEKRVLWMKTYEHGT